MKIKIQPVHQFVPGRGIIKCEDLNVAVGHYELGGPIRGNYELLYVDNSNAKLPPRDIQVASGRAELTPEQAEAWGKDDSFFAKSIAKNAGLTPL